MCSQKVLLFNASNMEAFPVYPYAFIQVPAVARQSGIEVICKDLLGVPEQKWAQTIQALIEQHNPVMILITLRNTDSLTSGDYERVSSSGEAGSAYFPIERTRELIATARAVSNLKIAVGGFGFSVMPDDLMYYLRPDWGVFGGADGFFAHFQDLQSGNLEVVPNLLYFQRNRLISNPRIFYPPLPDTEYTSQAIDEMLAFYIDFPEPGFLVAPVEIMRGCPHACIFCSEPHVAGRQVRYRDPSVVMDEIEFLVDHGIREIYMISSELNPEGNGFVLQLADRIHDFNELQSEDSKVTWFGANYLLNFSLEEYERLYQSGFTGGWFDVTALEDQNARAMRTPYWNKSLIPNLKIYAQVTQNRLDQQRTEKTSGSETQNEESVADQPQEINWTMFLGNPATTLETIRTTLRIANSEGLAQLFGGCHVNTNIRVFDYEKPDDETLAVTYSVTPDLERVVYQPIFPSYAYPTALLNHFGSEGEINKMLDHISDTYLSTKYQGTRNWLCFLKQNTTSISITSWVTVLSDIDRISIPAHIKPMADGSASAALQRLFSEDPNEEDEHMFDDLAVRVVDSLLSACMEVFPDVLESLGFPAAMGELERMTPYEMVTGIFGRWPTQDELIKELCRLTGSNLTTLMQAFIQFCVNAMLYKLNVQIKPKYRKLFVSK